MSTKKSKAAEKPAVAPAAPAPAEAASPSEFATEVAAGLVTMLDDAKRVEAVANFAELAEAAAENLAAPEDAAPESSEDAPPVDETLDAAVGKRSFALSVIFQATLDGDTFDSSETFSAPPEAEALRERVRAQLGKFAKVVEKTAAAYRDLGRTIGLTSPPIPFVVDGLVASRGIPLREAGSTGEALSCERLEPMALLAAETALELLA